jgi:hypothetical protein
MKPHEQANSLIKLDNQTDAQTEKVIWTPADGARIALMGLSISSLTAQTTRFYLGSTEIIPIQYTGANGNVTLKGETMPIAVGAADETLNYTTTAAVATSVVAWGYEWKG